MGMPPKYTAWREGQEKLFWDIIDSKERFSIHASPVGCHAKGTGILMYDGSVKRVEDVVVGDRLMGPDSGPRTVTQLLGGEDELFRVIPLRGLPEFVVNSQHVLHLVRTNTTYDRRNLSADISIAEYIGKSRYFKRHHKLIRADTVSFDTAVADFPLDAYLLGLWLGDGSSTASSFCITTEDSVIVDYIYAYAQQRGYLVRKATKAENKASSYFIRGVRKGNRFIPNPLRVGLRELGLCYTGCADKFIPEMYKTAHVNIRREILAGILDTDGSLGCGSFDLTLKSRTLLDDTIFVARSLGLMCAPPSPKIVNGDVYWRTCISGFTENIPTKIQRKRAARRRQKKSPLRTGFDLCNIGVGEFYGFTLDKDQLYLTADFCIHHNSGKSLAYTAAAKVLGGRTAILTITKTLQDQINRDFASSGVYDMRGLSNYTCRALSEGGFLEEMWLKRWGRPTCDVGPCTSGLRCDLKDSGCDYFDSFRTANDAEIVQTNFAYWIAIHKYGQGLGHFDRIFIDESHAAESQLSSALSVAFTDKEYRELGSKPPAPTASLMSWRMWARVQLNKIQGKLQFFTEGARIGQNAAGMLTLLADSDIPDATEMKLWKQLEGKMMMLAECTNDWIIGHDEKSGNVRIAPAFVKDYAESHLFLNCPRVGMFSGTVRPKIAALLGLQDGSWNFTEYESNFPVERRPIYWIPTVSLNYNSTEEDLRTWVVRIDQILARRLDRKGLIHTVSFPRQQYLLKHSRFRNIMHANTTGNTRDVVQSFKNASAPAVLVSPSIGTGHDFAFDLARYAILGKVPFRDRRDPILKAQIQQDPDYDMHLTAQDMEQMYGRINRDPLDFGETFCVDDNIGWFIKKTKFFSNYFLSAFQRVDGVPDAPPLSMFK